MQVAVIGNSTLNGGFAVAADLALAGHDIRLAVWSGMEATLEPIAARGGIELVGKIEQSNGGCGGVAKLRIETQRDAIYGAEVVVLDAPPLEFAIRFQEIVDALEEDQTVLFNLHGYWPALRVAPLLKAAGKTSVTLCETAGPTIAAAYANAQVDLQWMRRQVPVATFPAERRPRVFGKLKQLFPHIIEASNVIETGFAGLNMMVHVPLVLPNIGWFDRLSAKGELAPIYTEGNTAHVGKLAAALDSERRAACRKAGVPDTTLADYLKRYYLAEGDSLPEIIGSSAYYRDLPCYPADIWMKWLANDIPCAFVPFVEMAERAGASVPLHRAAIEMAGALLTMTDRKGDSLLESLGLAGAAWADILEFVRSGYTVA